METIARIRILAIVAVLGFFAVSIQAETTFVANLDGLQETPPNLSTAAGIGTVILNETETQVTITLYFAGLSQPQTAAHIHSPAPRGEMAGIIQTLPNGSFSQTFPVSAAEVANLKMGLWYFNIHNKNFPNGEIRGQIESPSDSTPVAFPFSNGSLDTTFDSDGVVIMGVTGNTVAQAVAIQADGKIVVAGFNTIENTSSDFTLIRYNPNGTLDNTFGGDGIVTTSIDTNFDIAFDVAIQPDGKIVVAGQSFTPTNSIFAIVRYDPDGTLDKTFDGDSGTGDGIITTTVGSGNQLFRGLAIQPDGKIIAVGDSVSGANISITVVRYNPDGTLDTTFDGDTGTSNGVIISRIGSGNELAYDVKIQPDGKIVVAGYFSNGIDNDVALLRYNTDGTLDTTFDGDGIATTAIGTRTDEAFDVALQADGKIVIAGCVNSGNGNDFLAIRYNPNGSLDTAFGTNGATVTPIGNAPDIAFSVAIQTDGKIVSAGLSNNGANHDFALIRQNPDGSLDESFDGDGKLTTQSGKSTDIVNDLAIQADGKIIAVGRVVVGSNANFGVVRYGYGTNSTTDDGFFKLNQHTAIRFDNAFSSGETSAKPFSALGLPPLPARFDLLTTPQIINSSAMFTGEVFVKLTLPTNIDEANFNAAQILQFENGAWTDKTAILPPRDFTLRTIYARASMNSPIAVVTTLTPPATSTSVTGRVLSAQGRYASGAIVSYTDEQGETRYATANPFGYFRFQNVTIGEPFIFRINSKRFQFAPRILSIHENFGELNFTGQ